MSSDVPLESLYSETYKQMLKEGKTFSFGWYDAKFLPTTTPSSNNNPHAPFFPPFSEMIWSDDLTGKYSDDNNTNSNSKHLHIMERRRREAGFTGEASASLLQLGSTTASDKVPPAEDYMRALWGVSAN